MNTAKFESADRHHCPLCQHTFTPDTPADGTCPSCGNEHTSYVGELVTLIPQAAPVTCLPLPEPTGICPVCDGNGDNGHHDSIHHGPCRSCDGDGVIDFWLAMELGTDLCECSLCQNMVEPVSGAKVGITGFDPFRSDIVRNLDLQATHVCCSSCLSDPENLDNIYGILILGTPVQTGSGHHNWEVRS